MSQIIAIPSANPGGLESQIGNHFGHCDLYTLVTTDGDQIADINVISNVPHEQGGCMAAVQHLVNNGVSRLIVGGMGMRPLMGFNQAGIDVFFGDGSQTVGQVVQSLLDGSLQAFRQDQTCTGGNCH